MKYLSEYRDPAAAGQLLDAIAATCTRRWTLMEVCGGQTHSLVRHGLDRKLAPWIDLLHGPGCPVCVTPLERIDTAHALAALPGVTLCTFGDMMRVPGSRGDLALVKAAGGDVRVVYSPLDALALAEREPQRQVVFFAVGFETTAPATATCVDLAARRGVDNFSLLASHVRVPPAVAALLAAPDHDIDALLGPGHVCTVMGTREYEPLVRDYGIPVVVTGFEPLDLLQGALLAVRQLESGRAELEIQYRRSVDPSGNARARELLARVFEVCDREFRGIGIIPESGLELAPEYATLDARLRFPLELARGSEPSECISGEVLRGRKKPSECPAFGKRCTPRTPLGATMVSSEGACAAYYAYARDEVGAEARA